ncbi:MAG: hypothetical protein IJU57_04470 [Clostridia bacterium]|nr:hypothetical protein [Clostridia bacterium]
MRKLICVIIASVMLVSCLIIPSSTVKVGDVIGYSLETDINAYIDGHLIRSYNVNNKMAIVAEDLRAYGFWVLWYPEERKLVIRRPVADGKVQYPYNYPEVEMNEAGKKIGTPVHEILHTDIRTYINGKEVEGFNINGETLIYFRELTGFGLVNYINADRSSYFRTSEEKCLALENAGKPQDTQTPEEKPDAPQEQDIEWSASCAIYNEQVIEPEYRNLSVRIVNLGMTPKGGAANFNILNDLPNGIIIAATGKSVNVSLYPSFFEDDTEFLKSSFISAVNALLKLGLPDVSYTDDRTNTDAMRKAYADLHECYVNDKKVKGDLWIGRGNGHVDINFDFTDGTVFSEGDVLSLRIGKADYTDYNLYKTVILSPKEGADPEDIEDFLDLLGVRVIDNYTGLGMYALVVDGRYTGADMQLLLHLIDESGLFDVLNREYLSHLD